MNTELSTAINQWGRHDHEQVLKIIRTLLYYTSPIDVRQLMVDVGKADILELFELLYEYNNQRPLAIDDDIYISGKKCKKFLSDNGIEPNLQPWWYNSDFDTFFKQ